MKKKVRLEKEIEALRNKIGHWKQNETLRKIEDKDPDIYKEFVEMFEQLDKEYETRILWLEKKKEKNSKIWSAKKIQEELLNVKKEYYGTDRSPISL